MQLLPGSVQNAIKYLSHRHYQELEVLKAAVHFVMEKFLLWVKMISRNYTSNYWLNGTMRLIRIVLIRIQNIPIMLSHGYVKIILSINGWLAFSKDHMVENVVLSARKLITGIV